MSRDPSDYAPHPRTGDLVKLGSPEWRAVEREHPPPYLFGVVPAGGYTGLAVYSLPAAHLLTAQVAHDFDDVLGMVRATAATPHRPVLLDGEPWALRDLAVVVVYDARPLLAAEDVPPEAAEEIGGQTRAVIEAAELAGVSVLTVTWDDLGGDDWTPEEFYERTGYGGPPVGEVVPSPLAVAAGRLVHGRTYAEVYGA